MDKRCVGCGEILQNVDKSKLGYTTNMDNEYCFRCFRIKNYNDLVNLDDINENKFEEQINEMVLKQEQKNKFFYILDVFNLETSRISSLERVLDDSDTVIVLNKIDLLPRSTNFAKILDYIEEIFQGTKIANAEIVLFSSLKKWGLDELKETIEENENNIFIGKTNVGKSSIINTLLKSYEQEPKIVESYFLNTTMSTIEIKLPNDINIIDTPGVAEKNSLTKIVDAKDLRLLFFKNELKQYSFNIFSENQSFGIGSLLFMNLNLIDKRDVHFFVNKETDLHRTNTKNVESYYEKNWNVAKPKTKMKYELETKSLIIPENYENHEIDIYFQDLGWMNLFYKKGDNLSYTLPKSEIEPLIVARKKII